MNRLTKLLNSPGDYPEDVRRLRAEIPELAGCHDGTIERLYRTYSDDVWAAGWMSGPHVEGFRGWLLDEEDE